MPPGPYTSIEFAIKNEWTICTNTPIKETTNTGYAHAFLSARRSAPRAPAQTANANAAVAHTGVDSVLILLIWR